MLLYNTPLRKYFSFIKKISCITICATHRTQSNECNANQHHAEPSLHMTLSMAYLLVLIRYVLLLPLVWPCWSGHTVWKIINQQGSILIKLYSVYKLSNKAKIIMNKERLRFKVTRLFRLSRRWAFWKLVQQLVLQSSKIYFAKDTITFSDWLN